MSKCIASSIDVDANIGTDAFCQILIERTFLVCFLFFSENRGQRCWEENALTHDLVAASMLAHKSDAGAGR